MCSLITRIGFLYRLRAAGKNVFEQASVWSASQKIFAHGHIGSEVCDSVGGEVMKLSLEEIQKTSEERKVRQRKTAVDVDREKDTLTLLWSRLSLVPRKPPRLMGNQPSVHQIFHVLFHDGRPDPVALDPAARQSGS